MEDNRKMEYQNYTHNELIEKIFELENLIESMKKQNCELLEFPWVGNLGHWYWRVKSNKVVFNERKVTALGYDKSEIPERIGHQFFTTKLHPDDYDRVMKNMENHLKGKTNAYEVEYRIRKKDGDYAWYYDRGKVTKRNKKGEALLVAGIVFDISKNKILEKRLKKANENLKKMAMMDELTGIFNRRTIMKKIEFYLHNCDKKKQYFSLIMFDLDDFKHINDEYGHIVGDYVLQTVALTVKESLKEKYKNYFSRWGGEEFIVLLPEKSKEEAVLIAEKLRKNISEKSYEYIRSVTASFGIIKCTKKNTVDSVIKKVDEIMYKAKRNGKNIVEY